MNRSAEDSFLPTRHSLVERLKDLDDQASWQEFFDTYWRLIRSVALKAGLTEAEAQDANPLDSPRPLTSEPAP